MRTHTRHDGILRLDIGQPFHLASSVESGQSHRWSKEGHSGAGPGEIWHWGLVCGNLIKIRPSEEDSSGCASGVEFRASPASNHGQLEVLLQSYFRLDDDIEAIYQDISKDPRVADMVRRYRGLRLLRVDPWECLISFICSANSNLPRIHANMETLSEHFGQPLSLDGRTYHSFPTPERLASAGEAALRVLGLGFRAPYVDRAAQAIAGAKLDLGALRDIPYDEAKERLVELSGVGSKIADCVLLHSLEKLEAFPIDVWVRRALADWYFPGEKPPPDRVMLEWARDHFGAYAGYAELYLFHGRRLGGKTKGPA